VNDTCDAAVVKALAALGVELVALRCAGFNNVDLGACREHGLSVVRVPEYSPYAVAEHTVGLMLMLNRGLHRAYERNRSCYFMLEGLTGFDMRGKTVGVIGTGKIGRCTVDILLGFGCQVLAFDKYPSEELGRRDGVEYVDLEWVWAESDIISLHVPPTCWRTRSSTPFPTAGPWPSRSLRKPTRSRYASPTTAPAPPRRT
jgi:D-lactate dehydrogenase